MVKTLTQAEQAAVDAAIQDVERATSSIVRAIIVPASYPYHEYAILHGLALGYMAGTAVWLAGVSHMMPAIMLLPVIAVALFAFVPWVRHASLCLAPKSIKKHYAARLAFQEYYAHHAHVPAEKPFVLLFISVAERYVHVITNPALHKKIPGGWESVTDQFAVTMRKEGLGTASVMAVQQIGDILHRNLG